MQEDGSILNCDQVGHPQDKEPDRANVDTSEHSETTSRVRVRVGVELFIVSMHLLKENKAANPRKVAVSTTRIGDKAANDCSKGIKIRKVALTKAVFW